MSTALHEVSRSQFFDLNAFDTEENESYKQAYPVAKQNFMVIVYVKIVLVIIRNVLEV